MLEPGGVCFITNDRAELAGAQLRFRCGFERHCYSNSLLDAAGGMLLHPNDVRIVRRGLGIGADKASHVRCGEWKKGAGIFPAFDFGMAISEGETAGAVVVGGRRIRCVVCAVGRKTPGIVNTVRVLIHVHPRLRRPGNHQIARFGCSLVDREIVWTSSGEAISAKPTIA